MAAIESSDGDLGFSSQDIATVTDHGVGKATVLSTAYLVRPPGRQSFRPSHLEGTHRPGERIVDLYGRPPAKAPRQDGRDKSWDAYR